MVVMAVALFRKIAPDKLCVAFGIRSNLWYIAVQKIVATINLAVSNSPSPSGFH